MVSYLALLSFAMSAMAISDSFNNGVISCKSKKSGASYTITKHDLEDKSWIVDDAGGNTSGTAGCSSPADNGGDQWWSDAVLKSIKGDVVNSRAVTDKQKNTRSGVLGFGWEKTETLNDGSVKKTLHICYNSFEISEQYPSNWWIFDCPGKDL
ncbi:hypothetical protein PYCC9005_002971 [Savitreella phatthalungensis]